MMTPKQYADLSEPYDMMAEQAHDRSSRVQMLARSYSMLAESTQALERSNKLLEALDRSEGA
jgi:hypothetical protein